MASFALLKRNMFLFQNRLKQVQRVAVMWLNLLKYRCWQNNFHNEVRTIDFVEPLFWTSGDANMGADAFWSMYFCQEMMGLKLGNDSVTTPGRLVLNLHRHHYLLHGTNNQNKQTNKPNKKWGKQKESVENLKQRYLNATKELYQSFRSLENS